MKIRLVGAELFHADGRRDMTNLNSRLRNFPNAPETHSVASTKNYVMSKFMVLKVYHTALTC